MNKTPVYLKGYEKEYASNPRAAALQWFRDAKFGLFLHYGLYSQLGKGEWVQHGDKIPVAEYAKLKDSFTAKKFDADFITDLACQADMKYITLTTRHHDSFSLWDSKATDFNSMNSPAKRDLVGELIEQCNKKGLGFFAYYSHGRDWKHPHAPNNDEWSGARPEYETPDPNYLYGEDHHLELYLEFMHEQLTELLTNYGPIAGVWFDGWYTPASGDISLWHLEDTYKLVHDLQPQALISYKWGVGTEDFIAPELHWLERRPLDVGDTRPKELCYHLGGWGYNKASTGKHRGKDDVLKMLGKAHTLDANILLNTGPLPDGSIDEQDQQTLRQVGNYICENGFPTSGDWQSSENSETLKYVKAK